MIPWGLPDECSLLVWRESLRKMHFAQTEYTIIPCRESLPHTRPGFPFVFHKQEAAVSLIQQPLLCVSFYVDQA